MKKVLLLLLIPALMLAALAPAQATGGAQISGAVFLDANGNGLMDANEKALANVALSLVRMEGAVQQPAGTATSGKDGRYAFSLPGAGTYVLSAELPKKHVPTVPAENGSLALPGNSSAAVTPAFDVSEGESRTVLIGAARKTGAIKVIAFADENANSGRFSTEPLLSKVLVEAVYEKDGAQYTVATATTNASGEAVIGNLTPGTYRVAATLPDPYIIGPVGSKVSLFYNGIVPSDDSRGLSEPFTLPAGGSIGMGVGGVLTGKLEGKVWMDQNANGRLDSGETGFAGARVQVLNNQKGVDRSYVTGTDGTYLFDKLQAGPYRLNVTLPDTAMFTVGGDSLLSNASLQSDGTDVAVELGKTTQVRPVGVAALTSLTVKAFSDQNINGLWDEGEPGLEGVGVSAAAGGEKPLSAVTGSDGSALFSPIRSGSARIKATLPDGQVFTVSQPGGSAFEPGAASAEAPLAIRPGAQETLLAGATQPAAIAGTVFDDADISGVWNEGEGFVEGVQVEAVNAEGKPVQSALTRADGSYLLSGLLPGSYTVRISIAAPYIFSPASHNGAGMENKIVSQSPLSGETAALLVAPGQTLDGIDAGVFRSAVINGKVLLGEPGEGFSGTLGGLDGVTVTLLTEDGAPVSAYTTADTDAQGAFSLKGALPGTYKLQYALPGNGAFTQPMQEEDTYVTDAFSVLSNDVLDVDTLYAVRTAAIGGTLYTDLNANGALDADEAPLPGASVTLTDSDGASQTAVSDENGAYSLAKIRPGSFTCTVTLPEGSLVMKAAQLPLAPALQNAASCDITLGMGEAVQGDIAVSPAAQLDVAAAYDNDLSKGLSDTDTPFSGAEVQLTHELTGETFTATLDGQGQYTLSPAFAGSYRFSVPLDADHALTAPQAQQAQGAWQGSLTLSAGQNQLALSIVQYGSISGSLWNMDGSGDSVGGLTLTLTDAQTNAQAGTVKTAADGSYRFDKLLPGSYVLSARIPGGFRFARTIDTQVRPSVIVSDSAEGGNGKSAPLQLDMGAQLTQQDIGLGATGKLGDFAWFDADGDGMQDAGEPGIPGLTIRFYRYGEMVAEATTDPYGRYLVSDLYPGEYAAEIQLPPELKSTAQQAEFPLVASVLPAGQTGTARAEGIVVPSKSRNLNGDFGFTLVSPGKYPALLMNLPTKDWTPLVPYTPTR